MSQLPVGSASWWAAKTRYDAATGCVLYTGFRNSQGYSLVHHSGRNKKILVHRLAYQQVYGPIDKGLVICHICDVPYCVNPKHLFAGTQKENLRDMFAKGRARPRGVATAPLTEFPAVSYRLVRRERQAVSNKETRKRVVRGHVLPLICPIETLGESEVAADSAANSLWAQVKNVPPFRPTQALALWDAEAANPTRWLASVALVPPPNSSRRSVGSPSLEPGAAHPSGSPERMQPT